MKTAKNQKRHTLFRLTENEIETLKRFGDGNMTKGLRALLGPLNVAPQPLRVARASHYTPEPEYEYTPSPESLEYAARLRREQQARELEAARIRREQELRELDAKFEAELEAENAARV